MYSRHFVTVVGFKTDTKGASYKDFLILDSWDANVAPITSTSRKINNKINGFPSKCSKGQIYYASVIK